jgi:hypothetical protein
MKIKTRRQGPGAYVVSDGKREVQIIRNDMLPASYGQWIAYALWDKRTYSDPEMTKKEAVRSAIHMLRNPFV